MYSQAKANVTIPVSSQVGSYTHLIWDFNGTILDDVDICIESINRMLEKRGLPVFTNRDQYRACFRFPVIEYYRAVGLDPEREDYYTVLAPEWVAYYRAAEAQCGLISGVRDALQRIGKAGLPQILLSATREEQLHEQAAQLHLADFFEQIIGNDNIHAAGKTHLVQAWKQAHPDAQPLFIGDTVHDAQVADAIGADCVLFTGGHQSEQRLRGAGKPLIRHMDELDTLVFPS